MLHWADSLASPSACPGPARAQSALSPLPGLGTEELPHCPWACLTASSSSHSPWASPSPFAPKVPQAWPPYCKEGQGWPWR